MRQFCPTADRKCYRMVCSAGYRSKLGQAKKNRYESGFLFLETLHGLKSFQFGNVTSAY